MVIRLITILTIMLVAMVVSHAVLPSEVYWQTVLPNTRMPKALQDRLTPDLEEQKTRNNVGKGGAGVNTGKPGGRKGMPAIGGVYSRPDSIKSGHKTGYARPDIIKTGYTRPDIIKTGYTKNYTSASEDQLTDDPNVALFFLEKDLYPGAKMNLHFTKTTNGATFLPRQIVNAIPFSSNKLAQIYQEFSVEPTSDEAMAMKQTVEDCEKPAEEGEEKYCATSLESMIDFSTSNIGPNVKAIGTEVDTEETHKQQYSISGGVRKMVGDNSVVCHGLNYPYAVFYCHAIHSTRAYVVPLVGDDGTKVKAAAVCHTDTAKWNPKHLAFQVLKVKPGTVPICHFISEDNIVWVPK